MRISGEEVQKISRSATKQANKTKLIGLK